MGKRELLESYVKEHGYVLTSDVLSLGISKTFFMQYVKENNIEKVANGIYKDPNTFDDPIYEISIRFKEVILSNETALFLHGLMEREPLVFEVTVKPGYNATGLRLDGVKVHKVKNDLFALGKTTINTNYGHTVNVYDMERTICDLVKNRKKTEAQTYQYAIKEYMRRKDKDVGKLLEYSKEMNCEDDIRKYLEVLT